MTVSKMIRGTMILTIAAFVSRILGILFVFPYHALTGDEGVNLYQYAYTPYAIMLTISTMGLPLAVSKFVSKYNAMGDYQAGKRLFKSGIVIMTVTGLIGFLILFLGAPALTSLYGFSASFYPQVVLMIRVVSIAILVVPVMSLIRGYFQGFQSMGPSAASQVAEQIFRVAFILIGSFLVIKVFNGTVLTAAAIATFAAFVGSVAGLYVMLHYWVVRRPYLQKIQQNTVERRYKMSYRTMYKELVTYAFPFVAVGLAMELYQLTDQLMAYHFFAYSKKIIQVINADLTMNDQKMVLIPVVLAISLASSAIPAIITSYSKRDMDDVHHKVTQAFELVLFLTIPASIGLSSLGYMIHSFFTLNPAELQIGGQILTWYAPSAILFALFQVTASILQGINHQKVTLISLGAGIAVKILLNPIFMRTFGIIGPILATDIGYVLCILINIIAIKKATGYRFSLLRKQLMHIIVYTAVMVLIINIIFYLSGGRVPHSRSSAVIVIVICVLAGASAYFGLAKWTGLLKKMTDRFRT